jgi:hypothetical protein
MALYRIFNGPAPTTASQAAVTTGTAIKTLLQVKPGRHAGGARSRVGHLVRWQRGGDAGHHRVVRHRRCGDGHRACRGRHPQAGSAALLSRRPDHEHLFGRHDVDRLHGHR